MKFEMEIASNDAHAAEDPADLVLFCMKQVQGKLPILRGLGKINLFDVNGNRVGEACLFLPDDDE